jgi:hypothetical protein
MKYQPSPWSTLLICLSICSIAPFSARAKELKPCHSNDDSAPFPEGLYSEILDLARISLLPADGAMSSEEQNLFPEELQTCLNTLKTNIAGKKTLALPTDPTLKASAEKINQVIQNGSEGENNFSLKSINPNRVEGLALKK